MDQIASLCRAYERQLSIPWSTAVAGAQRVWMAVYDPKVERRLRARIEEFVISTRKAGYGWRQLDLTTSFADWMNGHEYREAYFADPDVLEPALTEFQRVVASRVTDHLAEAGANDVLAIIGIGSLFPMARVSKLIEDAAPQIKGRLLVFFPGENNGSNYRLLNARDGWDYLAIAITPGIGEAS